MHPPDWLGIGPYTRSAALTEIYQAYRDATTEERTLVGVFGLALLLMLIIAGLAVSQYFVPWPF